MSGVRGREAPMLRYPFVLQASPFAFRALSGRNLCSSGTLPWGAPSSPKLRKSLKFTRFGLCAVLKTKQNETKPTPAPPWWSGPLVLSSCTLLFRKGQSVLEKKIGRLQISFLMVKASVASITFSEWKFKIAGIGEVWKSYFRFYIHLRFVRWSLRI